MTKPKKSKKNEFNKKVKKPKAKKPSYTGGGSWCSTMSRLNKRGDYTPGESW